VGGGSLRSDDRMGRAQVKELIMNDRVQEISCSIFLLPTDSVLPSSSPIKRFSRHLGECRRYVFIRVNSYRQFLLHDLLYEAD